MSNAAPAPERPTLSREFSEFLVDLSVALHKHAMYPTSHPSLEPAAGAVVRRANRLLQDRERIALGVARNQLIIEGIATDPKQPVLRRLAEGLHRHHLGAMSLSRGLQPSEIGGALRALSVDSDREGPLGLLPADQLPVWPHVRLHPLTFDRLALIADAPLAAGGGGSGGHVGSRGAELWMGLATAAMAGDASATPAAPTPAEPAIVARAIDEHQGVDAYDQVIVGYLLQIARELNETPAGDTGILRRRTGRLIATLKPETLRRLVEMGGDNAQRRAFVLDAAQGMAVDAVLEILKAAADASGQTISHGLVRMLSKLAAHAELGQEQARPLADVALREQVGRLLDGWQLADPNPEAYGHLLQHVATMGPEGRRDSDGDGDRDEPLRVAKMSLEIDGSGPLVDRAIDRVVQQGDVKALVQLLASLPAGAGAAGDALLARLLQPEAIATMLASEPIDFDSLDHLLKFMSLESHGLLLDALAASENRTTRRKLLDRLSATELEIGPLIVARLDDERWFVQRNMLVLLTRAGRCPAAFSATSWTKHPDVRVRHEAIRLQLTLPAERDLALRRALEDDDPRVVHIGLAGLQEGCPPAMAPLVVQVATNPKVADQLRLLAVRALGRSAECAECLRGLLQLVDGGRTLLGRRRLAPRTPMLLAALRALAEGWAADPRASRLLARAIKSSDPEVRQAAHPGHP